MGEWCGAWLSLCGVWHGAVTGAEWCIVVVVTVEILFFNTRESKGEGGLVSFVQARGVSCTIVWGPLDGLALEPA